MLIDISRPLNEHMAIYPGNPAVRLTTMTTASANTSALTKIELGSHTGTHIDALSHVSVGGYSTDRYDLETMVGPATVVDCATVSSIITAGDLPLLLPARLLLKTRNSRGQINEFYPDFVALDESAATLLVGSGVQLIGVDGPSIKKKGSRDKVHSILLQAGVVIVEGLWLAEVAAGNYQLICLPLPINSDGAPVRAVLRSS